MELNQITGIIIGCAIDVHRQLGPGLLESVYEACLSYEIQKKGLLVEQQVVFPLIYEEIYMELGYRVDILVEKTIVVEVKSIEALAEIHQAQVLTYLKFSGSKIGLLINFNEKKLVNGVKRLIAKT
ncbi:MAG TPA: GxxExxY protein [Chitinophagaceae bacterium]